MFKFDDFARSATAAVGALIFTAMTVGAAVTPASVNAAAAPALAAVQNSAPANV